MKAGAIKKTKSGESNKKSVRQSVLDPSQGNLEYSIQGTKVGGSGPFKQVHKNLDKVKQDKLQYKRAMQDIAKNKQSELEEKKNKMLRDQAERAKMQQHKREFMEKQKQSKLAKLE